MVEIGHIEIWEGALELWEARIHWITPHCPFLDIIMWWWDESQSSSTQGDLYQNEFHQSAQVRTNFRGKKVFVRGLSLMTCQFILKVDNTSSVVMTSLSSVLFTKISRNVVCVSKDGKEVGKICKFQTPLEFCFNVTADNCDLCETQQLIPAPGSKKKLCLNRFYVEYHFLDKDQDFVLSIYVMRLMHSKLCNL